MSTGIRMRHVASIAGAVQDSVSRARLGGALVEITDGPPAFQQMLAAQAADPAWRQQRERPDRTFSQVDGIFFFVDLPTGSYRLRVSAPAWGSRYGVVEAGPYEVRPTVENGPFPVAQADVDLPPTRIHGSVTDAVSGSPIVAARVRLLGDTTVIQTGDDGTYALDRQIAGKPTLQVSAAQFQSETRALELTAGQERVEDFALQPA